MNNNTAINIYVHVFQHLFVLFCWVYTQEWNYVSKNVCIFKIESILPTIFQSSLTDFYPPRPIHSSSVTSVSAVPHLCQNLA